MKTRKYDLGSFKINFLLPNIDVIAWEEKVAGLENSTIDYIQHKLVDSYSIWDKITDDIKSSIK